MVRSGKLKRDPQLVLRQGDKMKIKFNNYAKKIGIKKFQDEQYDWYRWRVFIEAPPSILNTIEYIDYILHPTFIDPNRRITDRSTKFALESEGWGSFMIIGTVHYKKGNDEDFEYYLDLHKSWPDNID